MNDARLKGAGGTPQTAGAAPAKFKSAAPMAAAALAVVAAVVGGTMLTARDDTPAELTPEATTAGGVSGGETASIDTSVDTSANTETAPDIQRPDPGSSVPGVAFDQTPGARPAGGVEIVVKFKDDAKVKDIIDAFWKDQASARAKFEAFKAGKPAFAGLKLDRVTYSNELVLVDASGDAPASRIAAMREMAARLKGNADISYADPNMTAHPGGQ